MSTLLRLTLSKICGSISKQQMRGWRELNIIRNLSDGSTEDQKFWVKSPVPDIEPVVGKTIPEFIWEYADRWGTKTAFSGGEFGQKYTFDELRRFSQGFAAGLMKLGVGSESVLSIVLPNIPEYPIALLGGFEAGCIVSAINPAYTFNEISRLFLISNTNCVVTKSQYLPNILKCQDGCPSLKKIILIDPPAEGARLKGYESFFDMMRTNPMGFEFIRGSEIDTTQKTALILYSSGTTGPPKAVELTHQSVTTNVRQFMTSNVGLIRSITHRSQDRLLGLIPFFHTFGLSIYNLLGLCIGAHSYCLTKFSPVTFVDALRTHRPTTLHLVPPTISFICESPDVGKNELESVDVIIGSAAPIGQTIVSKLFEKAGREIIFQECWGMTEMSTAVAVAHLIFAPTKKGSCGSLMPNTIGKIIDPGTGKALPANQNGEICIKGPQMMKGYLNNPKATAETIDGEGWLHTGDIGYFDHDGCLFIVDRLKELIKVKGFQVAPSELEDLLREHPAVSDVAVIGIPNEESGELPRAYIVSKDPKLTAQQIHKFLKDKVTLYKQLKGGIEFVKQIPKSPSGKILRRQILEEYKSNLKV